MTIFTCPVCGGVFDETPSAFICPRGHSFDRAAAGYVNLLRGSTPSHGDDKLMVKARSRFLDGGYYSPMRDALCETVKSRLPSEGRLLDAGCGEGYYTSALSDAVKGKVSAIDVSKTAVAAACKRKSAVDYAVASVYAIPAPNGCADMAVSVFSPFAREEFLRILKRGGTVVSVIPLERHLFSLKAAVYDKPYENEVKPYELEGFELLESRILRYSFVLPTNEAVKELFSMTPYYYRTPAEGMKRLDALFSLETEAQFGILVYRKKG